MGHGRLKYLLDSVILIAHSNGIVSATTFVSDRAEACALSVITRAEVLTGFSKESEPLALAVLNALPLPPLPLTTEIADSAADLRRSRRWKLPDAIQAAFAKHHDLTLGTRNTRDFQDGDEVAVLVPYRLWSLVVTLVRERWAQRPALSPAVADRTTRGRRSVRRNLTTHRR